MKNKLDRNFFISFVILIFRLFIIAFIVTFVVSLPLLSLDIISNFWESHFCYSYFTFIYFTYVLVNKDEGKMFDFLLTKDFKDDTDLNTYNEENTRENINSIKHKEKKQFCYDFSNPCPYCDTKFEHTALHCAVYFSDIERLEEVMELIKKLNGVDYYKLTDLDDEFFNMRDINNKNFFDLALSVGNIKIIKLLSKFLKKKGSEELEIHVGNNQWLSLDLENEDSIKKVIDCFKYKKKTKTGKDILDEDDKNPFSK